MLQLEGGRGGENGMADMNGWGSELMDRSGGGGKEKRVCARDRCPSLMRSQIYILLHSRSWLLRGSAAISRTHAPRETHDLMRYGCADNYKQALWIKAIKAAETSDPALYRSQDLV